MTPNDKPTGFIFKTQVKAALNLSKSDATAQIAFYGMPVSKLRYYLEQIRIPVIFVIVDATGKECFWAQVQGNIELERSFAAAVSSGQETMTVHVPLANILPTSFNSLLSTVALSKKVILVKEIQQLTSKGIQEVLSSQPDINALKESLRSHHDFLRNVQIEKLIEERNFPEAQRLSTSIFESTSESEEARAGAALTLIAIEKLLTIPNRMTAEVHHKNRLNYSIAMLMFARPVTISRRTKLLAQFEVRSALLRLLAEKDYGIYTCRLVQKKTGDGFTRAITEEAQARSLVDVARLYQRSQICIIRAIRGNYYDLLPRIWGQFVSDTFPFMMRLRQDGMADSAIRIREWLDSVGRLAFTTAIARKAWEDAGLCAITAMWLTFPDESSDMLTRKKLAVEWANQIDNNPEKERALETIDRMEQSLKTTEAKWADEEGDVPLEDEELMYRQMAMGLGVDVENGDDEVSKVVRIGLKDLNPERVLKNCQHLFVNHGFSGLPAQMLGMPTAGTKWLHCTKFKYHLMSLSLDDLYDSFRARHCESCNDCLPHPADWKWSREWQRGEDAAHKDLVDAVDRAFRQK